MNLPADLLDRTMQGSKKTMTAEFIEALEEHNRRKAVELFLSLKGTMKVTQSEYEEMVGKNDPDPWDRWG